MKYKNKFHNVTSYRDRHGKLRWRFRKGSFSAELGCDFGSQGFVERYSAAVEGQRVGGLIGSNRTVPFSLSDLVARYYKSSDYRNLSESTKGTYRGVIEKLRKDHGDKRISHLERRHVAAMMNAKSDTPAAANNMRKRLIQLLDHAILLDWITSNVAKNVKPLKIDSKGFHTWDEGEITQFFSVHGPDTLAHLTVKLMLYTGAARTDAVQLGWKNIKSNRIEYTRQKTIKSNGMLISIPLHHELKSLLDQKCKSSFTFLETSYGKMRTPEGLGNLMRKWCDKAGLPRCSAHGLRKACARRLAEAGATPHEIMSITGHKTLSEVERYTRDAEREGLANSAIDKLSREPNNEKNVANHPRRFANNANK